VLTAARYGEPKIGAVYSTDFRKNDLDLLIKNGLLFDPALGTDPVQRKDLFIRDGVIAGFVEDSARIPSPELTIIDAENKLIIPGLVNAHLHSHDHYDRGRFDNLPLELWILFIRPWIGARPLSKRELYLRTIIGAMEMVRTGTTLCIDDVNLTPFNTPENVAAVIQAYQDVGLRAFVSASVFDKPAYLTVPYVDRLLPQAIRTAMDQLTGFTLDDWIAFLRECLTTWNKPNALTHFILGPSAPQRCTDPLLLRIKALSDETGAIIMTHTLETKVQKVTGPHLYGKSVIAHLDDLRLLGKNTALIHCVWASEQDLDQIAGAGASIVHCPVSNLKLGSGIAPLETMLAKNINVGLGTDNTSCNDSQNLFEVMKFAALLPKIGHEEFSRWPEAKQVFRLATAGGAAVAQMSGEVGSVLPGDKADLVILDMKTPAFLPVGSVERNLVYSENGSSVETVIIDGKIVMKDRKLLTVLEDDLYPEIREAAARLKKEHRSVYEKAEEIYPYFKEAYFRCHQEFKKTSEKGLRK
jgi:5-methylthioadenosine/S-adenosylhomocysteine deaminase